eukprot:CAMPEP_0197524342 /NCGR_PEP_ID=MMETSP1318-20131121/9045_1 /TAXON_ID=552666 /ORGANISM="Partenskyella glossopodia, Strain RCC365" /LENGTH=126 /DNA_ID=CAMNT_0043077277 /DNA_START=58 /DNA_END=435 /DNA_ORIENTATION=+
MRFMAADINFNDVEDEEAGVTMLAGGSAEMSHFPEDDREIPNMKVDPANERFPFSIVWGPLPCLTWCFPCVGHMGIGDSQGKVHDFAGPYTVNTDNFMVGRVVRYYQLSETEMEYLTAKGNPSRVW